MLETGFLKHLNRLNLIIEKRISSNYVGERQSIHTGRGTMFKDHRIYTPGDDIRDIDWKVFARTDKLHVKRYEEDRNLTLHVIIDYSGSMNFGKTTKKYEYAAMLGLGFAYLSFKKNERFVLSTFSHTLEQFKPHKGRKQIVEIIDYLKNKQAQGESRFKNSLITYAKSIGSRSMIVVISDFLYDAEEVRQALIGFKNNKIILIQVLDEDEAELKLKGEFNLKDSETKSLLKMFVTSSVKKKYSDQLQEHKQRLTHVAHGLGAHFYSFTTGRSIYDAFFEILHQ